MDSLSDTAKAKWEEYFNQPSLWVDLNDDIGIDSRGSSTDPSQSITLASAPEELGRGLRTKTISTRLHDHMTNTVVQQNIDPPTAASPSPSGTSGKPVDIACFVNYNNFLSLISVI